MLKVYAEHSTPALRYVLDFLAFIYARPVRLADTDYDIYYGNAPPPDDPALHIPQDATHLLWRPLLAGTLDPAAHTRQMPFDLLGAIGRFLRDEVNGHAAPEHRNAHGVLLGAHSYQVREGIALLPVVNHYVQFLQGALRLDVPPLYPPGKTYAVILTHDVDRLQRTGFWRMLMAVRAITRYRQPWLPHVPTLWQAATRLDDGDFRRLLEVARLEARHGFASTFFFVGSAFFSRYRSVRDVYYDIRHPRYQTLLAELTALGSEIGLHASYNAQGSAQRLRAEKRALEARLGGAVSGLRHHYWHLGPHAEQTIRRHEEAGFGYDCSLAFNETLGFRRSVAWPFYPYLHEEERAARVLQLPTFGMDGSLFYTPDMTLDDARAQLVAALDALKAAQGLGVIDWHSDTAHPDTPLYERWGQGYALLLDLLASDSQAWVPTAEEARAWFAARG